MLIRLDGKDALYLQVYRALRQAILDTDLGPGSRLPPTRLLSRDLGVSRNVVLQAYDQLYAEGYVEGKVGAGTFVASELPEELLQATRTSRQDAPREAIDRRLSAWGQRALRSGAPTRTPPCPEPPLRWDFQYGEVAPDEQCLKLWRRLLARQAEKLHLNYSPAEGWPELRVHLSEYVRRSRGALCSPEQVLVVNGSQQALDLAARLLIEPGDPVVIEEPHYQGARQIFLSAGANLVPAPVDDEGLDLSAVDTEGARLAYVTPSHQFPTGAVMSLARRLELLDWAESHDAYLLEDDYDSEYRYGSRPVESVQGLDRRGRTIYIGTLSKVLFPSLRLGFIILPEDLVAPFVAGKWLLDRQTPTLEQAVLAEFIAEGHFERHLRRMRTLNAERRRVLLEALEEHLGDAIEIQGTNAGVHLLVWFRHLRAADMDELTRQAAAHSVGIYSVDRYFLAPPERAGIVLGYSSLSPPEIRRGVAELAKVVHGITAKMGR